MRMATTLDRRARHSSGPSIRSPGGERASARSPMGPNECKQRHIEQLEDLSRLLPDDALASVLRRLPLRSLAVSRCVRRAWRNIIDARRLALPHLLPHSVGGIFIKFNCLGYSQFLARPTTGPKVSGRFDHRVRSVVQDHCNGLILLFYHVANPATRRWALLPQRPPLPMAREHFSTQEYIVFDPAVSLHYEVLTIPYIIDKRRWGEVQSDYHRFGYVFDPEIEKSEWPPSPFAFPVFSSRTGQWEERSFLREGKAAGTIAELRLRGLCTRNQFSGAYWRGELYVHCGSNFVMRISLSSNKYQVIEPPTDDKISIDGLGRSEKGVYCVSIARYEHSLRVWILKEVSGQMKWALKHETNLKHVFSCLNNDRQSDGPWIFQDVNSDDHPDEDTNYEALEQLKIEWDSDSDNVPNMEDAVPIEKYYGFIHFLGFHPSKEIIFLGKSVKRGVAYHLNSSKFQDLGSLFPRHFSHILDPHVLIKQALLYTPCWIDGLPLSN